MHRNTIKILDYEVMSNESESMSQILFITFLETGEVLTCFPFADIGSSCLFCSIWPLRCDTLYSTKYSLDYSELKVALEGQAALEDQVVLAVQEVLEDLEVPLQNVQVPQEDQEVLVGLPQNHHLGSLEALGAQGDQEVLEDLEDQADQEAQEDQRQSHQKQEYLKQHPRLSHQENQAVLEAQGALVDREDQEVLEALGVLEVPGDPEVQKQQNQFLRRNQRNARDLPVGQEGQEGQGGPVGLEDLEDQGALVDQRRNLLVLKPNLPSMHQETLEVLVVLEDLVDPVGQEDRVGLEGHQRRPRQKHPRQKLQVRSQNIEKRNKRLLIIIKVVLTIIIIIMVKLMIMIVE